MARNRTPLKKAEVAGRTQVNPGRYRGRSSPAGTGPIGEPYANMTEPQKVHWREFAIDLPWLNSSHRVLLRLACHLAARLDGDVEMGVAAIQALSAILSKLGATPVDESRVSWPDEDEDEDEKFFRRMN